MFGPSVNAVPRSPPSTIAIIAHALFGLLPTVVKGIGYGVLAVAAR
jgi:hypothetical protein